MRDPADVIATALHENVVQGMTVEQWREKAVQVLAALRAEYGVAPNPNRIGFAIPVPDWDLADHPEWLIDLGVISDRVGEGATAEDAATAALAAADQEDTDG